MITSSLYTLFWPDCASETYLHGGSLELLADHSIRLHSPLLPSGSTLANWSNQPTSPQTTYSHLPLLERLETYTITCQFETVPQKTAYLKIDFFDAFHQLLSHQVIQAHETGQVTVPLETAYYQFRLVSAGCSDLRFDHILISQLPLPNYHVDRFWIKEYGSSSAANQSLFILLTEPRTSGFESLSDQLLPDFYPKWIIDSSYHYHQLYLNRELIATLKTKLAGIKPRDVVFIGYGPISNMAALCLTEQLPGSSALVSNAFYSTDEYAHLITAFETDIFLPNLDVLATRHENTSTIFHYARTSDLTNPILKLRDPSHRLDDLHYAHYLNWKEHHHL